MHDQRTGNMLRVLVFIGALACTYAASDPVVTVPDQGALQGKWGTAGIAEFLAVPYAAAPVGPRRWQSPAKPEPWSGTRMAHHWGAPCLQPNEIYYLASPSEGMGSVATSHSDLAQTASSLTCMYRLVSTSRMHRVAFPS